MSQATNEAITDERTATSLQSPRSPRTLQLGLAGALLCYLAHPPAGLSLLAWIGPIPWLLLVRTERLPGRRPYRTLWLAGSIYWLLAIQWIRLPFWANIFGLFLLAAYLGAYLPLFVALARVAVHRLRVPLWLAGAVVWTGLELLRAHLLSGFLMASLAHTQVRWPWVIQIADLGGEYAVTFLIMLVAGAIAAALPLSSEPGRPRPGLPKLHHLQLLPAAIAIALTLAYGIRSHRTQESPSNDRPPAPRIAIIQSDMLSDWKGSPERDAAVMAQQLDLSRQAVRESDKPIDLVVWPETMFRQPWFVRDDKHPPPPMPPARFEAAGNDLKAVSNDTGAALLLGIDRVLVSGDDRTSDESDYQMLVYNAAVFVDRAGDIQGSYAKMHLLPFGEFIPFAAWIPGLAAYAPITGNSLWGDAPKAFKLDDVVYAPNICYETVLPHLIRRQVVELTRRGEQPDVLVNLTNDSWFWGSSELDMHLASGVFRAIEMRTPLVIAANRGLSAYVDESGAVRAVTERDRSDLLVVDVPLLRRKGPWPSLYARWGDWLPLGCLVCCGCLIMVGWRHRRTPPPPLAV